MFSFFSCQQVEDSTHHILTAQYLLLLLNSSPESPLPSHVVSQWKVNLCANISLLSPRARCFFFLLWTLGTGRGLKVSERNILSRKSEFCMRVPNPKQMLEWISPTVSDLIRLVVCCFCTFFASNPPNRHWFLPLIQSGHMLSITCQSVSFA